MSKKVSRIIASIMLIVAVIFIVIALNNPQMNFYWDNKVTYTIYVIYIIIMIILFIAPFKNKD